MRHLIVRFLIVIGCIPATACDRAGTANEQPQRPVVIVHALVTDLFPAGEPANENARGVQALKALLAWIASAEDVEADALVLVGDLGFTIAAPQAAPTTPAPVPPEAAQPATPQPAPPPSETEARIKILVKTLSEAPRSVPIYVIPGGQRLAEQTQPRQALAAIQSGLDRVRSQLPAGSVSVIDISRCYDAGASDPSPCVARLAARRVRLVAYPAFASTAAQTAEAVADQQKWVETFEAAMKAEEGWQTVVIAPLTSPVTDTWPAEIRGAWLQTAKEASAGIGLLAPSAHRGRYERNEPWIEEGLEGRWFPTPALVSPVTAARRPVQGAAVLSLWPDSAVRHEVFWYAPDGSAFRTSTERAAEESGRPRRRFARAASFLWGLGSLTPLARTSLFAVAFLAAFLTVIAVWQIPPSTTTFTPSPTPPPGNPPGTPGTATSTTTTTTTTANQTTVSTAPAVAAIATSTFLSGNFARTAVSGLGGLAVAMLILDALWTTSKADAQGYYLVWFIVFFVSLLILSSLYRGILEGTRAVIVATPPARTFGASSSQRLVLRGWSAFRSWLPQFLRRLSWFGLVAGDVIFNVIQGRNEVEPAVLGKTIRELQAASLTIIDRVRDSLATEIERYLDTQSEQTSATDIRVSVSVLADDGRRTFYVSAPTPNLLTEFGEKSVAWVAVTASQARWWMKTSDYDNIELFDNTSKFFPPPHPASMLMNEYFMERKADYQAFIVIPIPLRVRIAGQRKAGLHISFKRKELFAKIWKQLADEPYGLPAAAWAALPAEQRPKAYSNAGDILERTPNELRPVLKQGLEVIEAAVRHFNELLFMNDVRMRRGA